MLQGDATASSEQGALAEGFRQAVDLMPHIVRIATGDHLIESVNTQDRLRRVAGEDLFGWKWLSIAQSDPTSGARRHFPSVPVEFFLLDA